MPDRVAKLLDYWEIQSKKENSKNNLELINRHWKNFDWDNEELDGDNNVKLFQQKLVHPDIIYEIPGV